MKTKLELDRIRTILDSKLNMSEKRKQIEKVNPKYIA